MTKLQKDDVIVNSYFNSQTDEDVALNMADIIAKLVNRNIKELEIKTDIEKERPIASL